MNGDSKYHAEVKVTLEGRECRINAFRDTLAEVFQDIGTICSQFPQDWKSPAKREILNAELKAQQIAANPNVKPTCLTCKSDKNMELVDFTARETGEQKQAWKCQKCKKWFWPPK